MAKEIRHCYRELTEKVRGLADVDYKCMTGLQPLKTLTAKKRLNQMIPTVAQNS
jgi:hypothetical protein